MLLSLIVVSSFVYISLSVNKNIKLNNFLDKFLDKNSSLETAIYSWQTDLWDWEFLKFDNNSFVLNDLESIEILFSWSESISWTINLVDWWAIKYDFLNSSWIITKWSSNWFFSWMMTSTSKLFIHNLAGIANFNIDVDSKYLPQKYKIVKNIWWKNIEKNIIEK